MLARIFLAMAMILVGQLPAFANNFLCGVSPRVIGGSSATHEEAPYQAVLTVGGTFQCGGSIISRSFVLTAAHCVKSAMTGQVPASEIEVLYGSARVSQARTAPVSAVYVHEDYDPGNKTSPHDIAVLQMARPLDTPRSAILTLASEKLQQAFGGPGACARVTGFGKWYRSQPANQGSDQLLKANMPIQTRSTCDPSREHMTSGMLCAGYRSGGVDSCNGDSGGPLVVRGGPVRWLQIGIVSFGDQDCGKRGTYGYYTRVASHIDWIKSVTRR